MPSRLPNLVAVLFFSLVARLASNQDLPAPQLAVVDPAAFNRLWLAAQAAWQQGEDYQAGRMRILSEDLDSRGRVSSTTTTELALRYVGGQTVTEVLSSIKDGRDISAQTRIEYARQDRRSADGGETGGAFGGGSMAAADILPFAAQAADALRRAAPVLRTGQLVVPYELVRPKFGAAGELFFNPDGHPQRLVYTLKPLPPFVSRFDGDIEFQILPDGALVVSAVGFSGEGGFLLIRKYFRVRMDFSDYRRPDLPSAP